MIRKVTVRQAGGSVSITVPKDIAERHHLSVGEEVFVVETDEGVLFTAYDPEFERAVELYAAGAKQFKNALRELAK
jgi:antitoxin component of MazEF toxin-antitoxin module